MAKGKEPRCRERGSAVFLCRRGPTRSRTDGEGCELQAPRGKGASGSPFPGDWGESIPRQAPRHTPGGRFCRGRERGWVPAGGGLLWKSAFQPPSGSWTVRDGWALLPPLRGGEPRERVSAPLLAPHPAPHEGLTLGTRDGALLVMRGSSALASITMPGAWRALSDLLMNAR